MVPATNFAVISDTEITAVSPPQGPSIQNIHVTTAGGTSQPVVDVDPFTFVTPVASITGVAPASGTTAGGTSVAITGTGFTGATKVIFGAVPAAKFTVVSDTEITALSPAQGMGTRNIVVTSAIGTTTPVGAPDQFTYKLPVSVTGVAPASGPKVGGTPVVITGTGFTGATNVIFGAVPAANFTVVSDTEITALSPAQGVGTRNIVVTAAVGTSAPAGTADQFTYKP